MASILLTALAVLVVLILPVMLAARLVQARNQGLVAAGLALVMAAVVDVVVSSLFVDAAAAFILQVGLVGFVFSQVLGTDYLRGLAVSLIWGVFSLGIVTLLGKLGVSHAMLNG